jgi:hypothetical protein
VRERLANEVPWIAVKEWASARVERWQRDAAGEPKTKAAAIRATLAQITDHADKPGERTPNGWMADYAKAQLALNGAPAKREDALRACREGACCTYRKALEAWNGLPVSMKRKPRETDRALTGR